MYLAGVSVRRVEDITEALWGTRVSSPSTVSDLNKKIYATIEAWRNRPIEGEHPYVYLDGIVLKSRWAGRCLPALLVAIHASRQSCSKAGKARIFALFWESSGESRLELLVAAIAARRHDALDLLARFSQSEEMGVLSETVTVDDQCKP